MVGLARYRFVNLTAAQLRELSCHLCGEILWNPVLIPCCRKMYCRQCLLDWRYNNNVCADGKHWLSPHLMPYKVPQVVLHMLAELEIHCNYWHHGCAQLLRLKQLSQHADTCGHNPKRKSRHFEEDDDDGVTDGHTEAKRRKARKNWGPPTTLWR